MTPSTPFQGGAVSPNEQQSRAPEWRERPATPNGPGIPALDMATVPMMKTPAPVAAHQASSNPPAPRSLPRDMLVTQPGTPGPFLQQAPRPPAPVARPPSPQRQGPVFASPSFEELPQPEAPPARLQCIAAWLVDALCIVALLAGLLAVVTPSAFGELRLVLASRPSGTEWLQQFVPVLAAGALIGFIYVAFFGFAAGGVSPGRALAGLRLVDGTGETPGPMRAVVRAALSLVSFAPGAVGFLLALVTPRRQTLHDLLLGTAPARR